MNLEKHEDFFQMVFQVVRLIPKGRVTSYGAIAKYLGKVTYDQLITKTVDYYNHEDQPKEAWPQPQKIAFRKNSLFSWQNEYRIAYPINGAFGFEKVELTLENVNAEKELVRKSAYGLSVYNIGNIGGICKLHEAQ